MKTMNLASRHARLLLGLLCIFCFSLVAQADRVYNSPTRANWSVTTIWTPNGVPLNEAAVFGQTPEYTLASDRRLRPFNALTTVGITNISLKFYNYDGWAYSPGAAAEVVYLNSGGIYQDASVVVTAAAGQGANPGQNRFYAVFKLLANASIINNSTQSTLNFRHDNSQYTAGIPYCLTNNGFTLTFDGPGTNTFSTPSLPSHAGGAIAGSGSGGVIKNGTGLTELLAANTYPGPTVINAGKLTFNNIHAGGGSITVADGAALQVGQLSLGATLRTSSLSLTNSDPVNGTNTLTLALGSLGNPTQPLIYATNLNLTGTNYVTITGSGLAEGTVSLIKYDTLNPASGAMLITNTLPPGVQGYLTNNAAITTYQLVITQVPDLIWRGNVSGNWDIASTLNWTNLDLAVASTFNNGVNVVFNDSTSVRTVTVVSNVVPAFITVSNTGAAYTFQNNGVSSNLISGSARIIKDGTGALILASSNSYSGVTVIKKGTVQTTAAFGVGPASDVTVSNAATLDLGASQNIGSLSGAGLVTNSAGSITLTLHNGSQNGNFTGTISESSPITLSIGAGLTTLSGNNNYSGGTEFSGTLGSSSSRRLFLAGNNPLGTGSVTWKASSRLSPADSTARSLTNALYVENGTPTFGNAGAGLLTCSGPITFNPSSSTDVTMVFDSDVVFSGSSSSPVAGPGFTEKRGSGKLTLQGSTYSWIAAGVGSDFKHTDGDVTVDGASVTTAHYAGLDTDWRIATTVANGVSRLVITNNGSLTLTGAGNASLFIGFQDGNAAGTNIADIAGTLNAGTVVVGQGLSAKAVLNLNSNGVIIATKINSGSYSNTVTTLLEAAPNEVNLNGGTLQAAAGASTDFMSGLTNVYVLGGGVTVDTGTNSIRIDQNLLSGGGAGGLTKLGTASLALNGNNTYTGTTWIQVGGLYGTGTFAGNVQIASSAILSPAGGGTNIGTVTITSGGLTLDNGATLVITLNKDNAPGQTNDYVNVTGGVTAGATAVLSPSTNGVTPFVVGDQFQIFPPGTAFGGTISTNQAPAGTTWSYNSASGILSLVSSAAPPPPATIVPGSVVLSGGSMNMVWSGYTNLTATLQTATNLSAPVWTPAATNVIGADGLSTNSVIVIPGEPKRFYRLSQP